MRMDTGEVRQQRLQWLHKSSTHVVSYGPLDNPVRFAITNSVIHEYREAEEGCGRPHISES